MSKKTDGKKQLSDSVLYRIPAMCALALLILLCACMKKDYKQLDASAVRKKLENRQAQTELFTGAEAPDSADTARATVRLSFRCDPKRWHGSFYEFPTEEDAVGCYEAMLHAHPDSYSRFAGGNGRILEYAEETEGEKEFRRVSCVGSTLLVIACPEDDETAMDDAAKLRAALGY